MASVNLVPSNLVESANETVLRGFEELEGETL